MAKTTKREVRFYTEQELNELTPFINGELSCSEKNLSGFCKKYNRSLGAVQILIYKAKNKKTKALFIKVFCGINSTKNGIHKLVQGKKDNF